MKKFFNLKEASSTKIALIIIALYAIIVTITFFAW